MEDDLPLTVDGIGVSVIAHRHMVKIPFQIIQAQVENQQTDHFPGIASDRFGNDHSQHSGAFGGNDIRNRRRAGSTGLLEIVPVVVVDCPVHRHPIRAGNLTPCNICHHRNLKFRILPCRQFQLGSHANRLHGPNLRTGRHDFQHSHFIQKHFIQIVGNIHRQIFIPFEHKLAHRFFHSLFGQGSCQEQRRQGHDKKRQTQFLTQGQIMKRSDEP